MTNGEKIVKSMRKLVLDAITKYVMAAHINGVNPKIKGVIEVGGTKYQVSVEPKGD